MSLSLTYQELPPDLLEPLMQGVISLAEASELFDLVLMADGDWADLPPHLEPAADRILLWKMVAEPTLH